MANWYAKAIDELERIGDGFADAKKLREIAVDYAKRHPKAFYEVAKHGPRQSWQIECAALIKSGKIIDAIKLRRNETGESLKDARDWCVSRAPAES